MEIKGFDNALDYQTMIRDMTKASRLDRNERDERGVWNVDFFRGQEEANIPDHVAQYSMHWMNKMRAMFEGHIIRRDSNSVTYNGKSIIDIKPYKYVALELALTPTEQDGLDEITTAFEKKSSNKRTEGQVCYDLSSPYLSRASVCRSRYASRTHTCCCPRDTKETATSLCSLHSVCVLDAHLLLPPTIHRSCPSGLCARCASRTHGILILLLLLIS